MVFMCACIYSKPNNEGRVGLLLRIEAFLEAREDSSAPLLLVVVISCLVRVKGGMNFSEEQQKPEIREEMIGHLPSSRESEPPV